MQRRRGAALETALLEAAWAELTDRGYANFTLESVAQRAGTSTPVIYRRWTTKAQLIQAAIAHASAGRVVEIRDTGSLRGDLIALMRAANETRMDLLAGAVVLLGTYFEDTGTNLETLRAQVLDGRRSAAEVILQRAIDRGEVDATVLTPRLVSLPFDLFRHELLMTLRPVSEEAIVQIVDDIVLPLLTGHVR
ncbi:TetR/AcrR family transcriptional regulator [Cryptosporangium sp. NPDC051539]|uniref:TetR/AcrR family transcriptional regulator n=1 Tax=Cryptosporangium sp. NPDC051539 TaxID=3363962 RepID=UPI0037991101